MMVITMWYETSCIITTVTRRNKFCDGNKQLQKILESNTVLTGYKTK